MSVFCRDDAMRCVLCELRSSRSRAPLRRGSKAPGSATLPHGASPRALD